MQGDFLKNIRTPISRPFWLPLFVSLFPVLLLYSHNKEEVVLTSTFLAFAAALFLAGTFFFLSWVLFRNEQKAALISGLAVLLFFSYSDIFYIDNGDGLWIRHRYLMGLYVLMFLAIGTMLFRTKKDLLRLCHGMMFGITAVLLTLIVPLGVFKFKEYQVRTNTPAKETVLASGVSPTKPPQSLPDIYYIVPDGYPGAWTFVNEFQRDNSLFYQQLQDRGFYVNPTSISNYNSTTYTLNAVLNMNYMEELVPAGVLSPETVDERSLIRNNIVGRYVKKLGYTYVHAGDRYEWNYTNPNADININIPLIPEFFFEIWNKTILHPLRFRFAFFDLERRRQMERILYQFDELAKVPLMEEPTLTIAHLSTPHRPFVFREDGSFVTATEESAAASTRTDYPRQVAYINQKLIALVDTILTNSKEPPIIIIQSDHGARLYNTGHMKTEADIPDEVVIDRLNNFSAWYLPGVQDSSQLKYLTQANIFRFLFNTYLGGNFELLPDRNYLLTPWNGYLLLDRTDFMRQKLAEFEQKMKEKEK